MTFGRIDNRRLSRRSLLGGAAGLTLGAALAGPGRLTRAQEITFPDNGAVLPEGDVTLRWMDSGDLKALFEQPVFEAYMEAHPNVTIQYDGVPWDVIGETVPLGVRNGSAPDVFAMPLNIPSAQAVAEGWVGPIDEVVPNFSKWKAGFPFGSFVPGVHEFDGKTYTFSLNSNKRLVVMLYFMPDVLQEAGYDPLTTPLSWDTFRDAAKKITEQGNGERFGLIFGGKSVSYINGVFDILPRLAGARGSDGGIDWTTGEFIYTSPEYLGTIELLQAIKDDGSMVPGEMSLSGPDVRARFSQGIAGMIFDGPWDIPRWKKDNPDFSFNVAMPPVPTSGEWSPITFEPQGDNRNWLYAESQVKEVVGDIFHYMGSLDGQTQMMILSQGNLRSVLPEANAAAEASGALDPVAVGGHKLADQTMRVGPIVAIRNPDAVQVQMESQPVHPDLGEIVQGVLTGQIDDAKQALQSYNDALNAELDRAIKAAQDKGAEVSRDDWVFPNWDVTKDYTQADYDALSG
jgi:multiple sugar transport system substrate-binding protein